MTALVGNFERSGANDDSAADASIVSLSTGHFAYLVEQIGEIAGARALQRAICDFLAMSTPR